MSEITLHRCEPSWASTYPFIRDYGSAIEECVEDADGTLWVGNHEYSTRVNFCPFCGFKAKSPVTSEVLNGK